MKTNLLLPIGDLDRLVRQGMFWDAVEPYLSKKGHREIMKAFLASRREIALSSTQPANWAEDMGDQK